MKEIRCSQCNKKLAEADYRQLVIECPRCGVMNTMKATEPPIRVPGAQKESLDELAH